jgi:hypothetical protein
MHGHARSLTKLASDLLDRGRDVKQRHIRPSRANSRATASPIPLAQPITTAAVPFNSRSMYGVLFAARGPASGTQDRQMKFVSRFAERVRSRSREPSGTELGHGCPAEVESRSARGTYSILPQ